MGSIAMGAEHLFAELDQRYAAELACREADGGGRSRISMEDADRWASALGVTGAGLCNLIAANLAESFHVGRRSFDFCDAVANELFVYFIERGGDSRTDLYWPVFLAFDAGEFTRSGEDDDPVERYTRPQIAEIVAALRAAPATN
jgi:hypothetical protein